jgi:hypothetical protein
VRQRRHVRPMGSELLGREDRLRKRLENCFELAPIDMSKRLPFGPQARGYFEQIGLVSVQQGRNNKGTSARRKQPKFIPISPKTTLP